MPLALEKEAEKDLVGNSNQIFFFFPMKKTRSLAAGRKYNFMNFEGK